MSIVLAPDKPSYHSDEKSGLLSSSAHTCITNNANGEASGQTSQTDTEAGTQLDEGCEERQPLGEVVGDQDGHDQAVDTNDTRHDNGNNVWDWLAVVRWQNLIDLLLTIRSGRRTPMAEMPTPDLAVP